MLKFLILLAVFFSVGVVGVENDLQLVMSFMINSSPLLDNVSANCRKDFLEYFRGILQGEMWALRMFDSMEKLPVGLLEGRVTLFGQFEECLSTVHRDFKGQHCVVDVSPRNFTLFQVPESHTASRSNTGFYFTIERLAKRIFAYGVCLPSTCNSTDLKSIIAASGLNEIFDTEVTELDCTSTAYQELRVKDYVALAFLIFNLLLAMASTVYEVYQKENKGTKSHVLKSFSLISNCKTLFNTTGNDSEMGALNGIRFLSIAWVILGHGVFIEYVFGDAYNMIEQAELPIKTSTIHITNSFLSVDSFFFLTGLLICFVFFREISKKGSFDFPVAVIQRYFRLTVPVFIVFLLRYTIFSRILTGPPTKKIFESVEQNCEKSWWTFLLYIQNLSTDAKECFAPGWYVAADMQLFLVSPLIMYLLFLRPKFAPTYFGLLIIGSSLTSFVVGYIYDLPPNYLQEWLKGIRNFEYYQFYTRMTPWIVGIATGYILCGIRSKRITFQPTRVWLTVGWMASALLCLGSLYGIAAFLPPGLEKAGLAQKSTFERSAYRSFHRLGWSLGLAWIVVACVQGYGGPVNAILSLKLFRPLGKLTYCMYLIHVLVQRYRYYHFTRHSTHANFHSKMYIYSVDLVFTTVISIPMTLLFEMPFINLAKTLFRNTEIFPYPKPEKRKAELKNISKS